MEQRVEVTEKCEMPVPENIPEDRHESDSEKQRPNQESKDKNESLPPLGRLSLNVKAVPYIPKQDSVAFSPSGGENVPTISKSEPSEKREESLTGTDSAENSEGTATKSMSEKQSGGKTEDELRVQVAALKINLKHYEEMIDQYQASEQTRKREVDSALTSAREVVERERREKLDVLSDRKSRQEQFEHLSKTLSVLQAENDELRKHGRQQDEKLKELTRLKTLIQENGFPNIEQFLMLQQQIDSFRDDFLSERKERERLQSQKDKIKRELEAAQSRIASLQEQVYKYREHIYFIQNKYKSPSPFRALPFHGDSGNSRATISTTEACKLYGPNAPQYINQSLALNAGGAATVESKFQNRGDKKPFPGRYNDTGGRQWQDSRMPRPMSGGDDWKRVQTHGNRNGSGYFNNNMHRLTPSTSAPSLAALATGEQSGEVGFYDKQYSKPGFQRRTRSSLADDATKDYGMQLTDWSKQSMNKQGKRFSSPLASPNLLTSPAPEYWSSQQPPALGFQKGWQPSQDEIFRFPPSPLTTPTSKASFDSWPNTSTTIADDQDVFSPSTCNANDEGNFFPLTIPSSGRKPEGNFGRFTQNHATSNGKVYVCYNCGINFDDNVAHSSHVETCGL